MFVSNSLGQLASAWREGRPTGMYSVCSAHPWVIEAALDQALADGTELLIEATSNQVNHWGGYTGMKPGEFRDMVAGMAAAKGFDASRLILGGDHLGPHPWRTLPAAEALCEAERTVEAYARAGFTKIHLDASMACADERDPLAEQTIAERAAALCAAAERVSGDARPVYVIGTEVPVPGGATGSLTHVEPTSRESAVSTLDVHRRVFAAKGLGEAWQRVIALVVQPGVEFNHMSVVDYDPAGAVHLTELLREQKGLVFEAHSTDYQRPEAYRHLVRDGFAILKVGPALTFALREALGALSLIEAELVGLEKCSRLMDVLERVMLGNPGHWERHYAGTEPAKRLLRRYSYSDRARYYWAHPQVNGAVETLMENLKGRAIPETLLSAYLPEQYRAVRAGALEAQAKAIVLHRIRGVLRVYAEACGGRN